MEKDAVFMARRDRPHNEKTTTDRSEFIKSIADILEEMQSGMLQRAREHRNEHITIVDTEDGFYEHFRTGEGGFAMTHFSGDVGIEERIKKDLAVTVRCIPSRGQGLPGQDESGTCPFSGDPSPGRVVWARSY